MILGLATLDFLGDPAKASLEFDGVLRKVLRS